MSPLPDATSKINSLHQIRLSRWWSSLFRPIRFLQAARTPEDRKLPAGSGRSAGEAAGRAVSQAGGGAEETGRAAAGKRRRPGRERRAAAELHAAAGLRYRASDPGARAGREGAAESPAGPRDPSIESKPRRYILIINAVTSNRHRLAAAY